MSAFIVSDKHINTIVTWASMNWIGVSHLDGNGEKKVFTSRGHEQAFATALMRQNVRSVNFRYNENTDQRIRFEFTPIDMTGTEMLLQIFMACRCYQYQACETDNYDDTLAAQFISNIMHFALTHLGMTESQARDRVNDFDSIEWEIR